MKVIGFEEHYKLPAISEASPNEAFKFGIELLKKAGWGHTDLQGQWPAGICDLGEGRIAAMDAAGIDIQILSHTVPGPETVEPSLAVKLAKQANDTVAAAVAQHPVTPQWLTGRTARSVCTSSRPASRGATGNALSIHPPLPQLPHLLSPERRRAAVRHLQRVLGVSERFACRVAGQHRATQRHEPLVRAFFESPFRADPCGHALHTQSKFITCQPANT
jgi:hypothetical protein